MRCLSGPAGPCCPASQPPWGWPGSALLCFHANPGTNPYPTRVHQRVCMGRTPRKKCPRCENRRVLIAVTKQHGEPLYECLCRACAEAEGHSWGSDDEGSGWPITEDEHDGETSGP